MADRQITVALLAASNVTASTLYGFLDAFAGVERDWQGLHGRPGSSPFRPLVVSRDGGAVAGANGVTVMADASFAECGAPDVACVTDLMIAPGTPLAGLYDAEAQWLRTCHAAGAIVASSCSGAMLLAYGGLLDGLDATSHWAYCDALRRDFPATRWHPERGLVAGGPGQRIVMAGSGIAWHQLALALISRFAGTDAAMQVARINLMDWNAASPVAYASLRHGAQAADPWSRAARSGPHATMPPRRRWRGWWSCRGCRSARSSAASHGPPA
jgi:transcriptional regulator GlxA family with amidase domain